MAAHLPGHAPMGGETTPTPLAEFLQTETASAVLLLLAAAAGLAWANVSLSSYEHVWEARLSIGINGAGVSMSVSEWINRGLMTLFFFVVGLEARREIDVGELRDRQRIVLPALAGAAGMAAAVGLYSLFNAGSPGEKAWGTAMSTDTAFALGTLALVGPRFPERLRAFLLTVMVTDDVASLVVIATFYAGAVRVVPLAVAVALFALVVAALKARVSRGWMYFVAGVATWVALSKSGIDPLVVGLAMGLLTYAAPPTRSDLERASALYVGFREQPTPELARAAGEGLRAAVSRNERLQHLYHPWVSFTIVPLFALSQMGFPITGRFLATAVGSPITDGIVVGFVVGKPLGVLALSALTSRVSGGRLQPPVGWLSVAGTGTLVGIGFTVSLLVASIALKGVDLQEAKLGILAAVVLSAAASWAIFTGAQLLPAQRRTRLLLGTAAPVTDLVVPVDPARDHVRGPASAPVTLVEYGDFECPYCGVAEREVRELLAEHSELRYVWRHLPLVDVHPNAGPAAEAAEAAALQGGFWAMHDQLLDHQDALRRPDLLRYAADAGLDVERFAADLDRRAGSAHVAEDVEGAGESDVAGTPTFFVNGRRLRGAYDLSRLTGAVELAKQRFVGKGLAAGSGPTRRD